MNEPHMAAWWFPANDHPARQGVLRHPDHGPEGQGRHRQRRPGRQAQAARPDHDALAGRRADGDLPRVLRGRLLRDPVVELSGADQLRRRLEAAAGLRAPRRRDGTLAQQTCDDRHGAARSVLGPYPFSATGGCRHRPPGRVRAGEPDAARPTPRRTGRHRDWWRTSSPTSGSATRCRSADWRDIWLNEGFAQYLQTYYSVEVARGHSMQTWLSETYDSFASDAEFWKLSIDDPGPEHLFDGPVYARGAMAVQALRHRIGDTAFWTLLRTWVDAAPLRQRLGRGLRGARRRGQRPGPRRRSSTPGCTPGAAGQDRGERAGLSA